MEHMSSPKVVFITGCSSGLGFSTAVKLVNAGYIVYASMRSLEKKGLLEKACNDARNLHVIALDLENDLAIQSAVKTVLSTSQRIDVVIHNAATALLGPVDTATPEEFEHLFKVNVFSILKLTQLFLPKMREQMSGHLVFVGSIAGIESCGYLGAYAATKFALEAMAASWATTLHKWNIQSTIIEPGAMNTDLPNKIPVGSYYKSTSVDDPYKHFNKNALKFLRECLKDGTDPDKVSGLILEILNSQKAHLRYQTCDFSERLVAKHLYDPKGDRWVEEHRHFIEPFYEENFSS